MSSLRIDPARFDEIKSYLAAHPTHGSRRISRALGVPRSSVERALQHLTRHKHTLLGVTGVSQETAADLLAGERVIECRPSATIRTLDDLLAECKVDTKVWEVDHYIANKHDLAYKDEAGEAHVVQLFQIKAWLKRRPGPPDSAVIRQLWEDLRKEPPLPMVRAVSPRPKSDKLLEISIPDLHYGSLAWAQETREDYDSKIAETRFLDAVRSLLDKGLVFGFSRVLFPVGSDFFHVDNPENSTTAGTRLDADTRWQRSFTHGVRVVRQAIEMIRRHAPVDIVVVSGNHDTTRAFYLGELLAAAYEKCKDVTVNNSPAPRKYYRWGTVLLGLAHGDKVKTASLPNLMAGEAAADWAATTHREWHVGHLHHAKEHWFEAGREQNATRIRTLPSLAGTDSWHTAQGYVGARKAAEAYLWSLLDGYVGHFSFSPR